MWSRRQSSLCWPTGYTSFYIRKQDAGEISMQRNHKGLPPRLRYTAGITKPVHFPQQTQYLGLGAGTHSRVVLVGVEHDDGDGQNVDRVRARKDAGLLRNDEYTTLSIIILTSVYSGSHSDILPCSWQPFRASCASWLTSGVENCTFDIIYLSITQLYQCHIILVDCKKHPPQCMAIGCYREANSL